MERKILIEFNGNIRIRYAVAKRLSEIGLAPAYAAGNNKGEPLKTHKLVRDPRILIVLSNFNCKML